MSSQQNVEATATIGLHAVARHLINHALPARDISSPRTCLGESSVIVQVWAEDAQAWCETIHVDGVSTTPSKHPDAPAGLYERVAWHGRLPESGVRVSVVTVRRVAVVRTQLTRLPGGAA